MKAWSMRPVEVAALLNPAFGALLLRESVKGFVEENPEDISYPALALVLPIILHRSTREVLPQKVSSRMHAWLQEHQDVRIGFAQRCIALMPYFREALLFACNSGLLSFKNNGLIFAPAIPKRRSPWGKDSEPAECMKRARFVGRWLSGAGDIRTIYAMWGVRP